VRFLDRSDHGFWSNVISDAGGSGSAILGQRDR
jgi:hypothetical protein